MKSNLKNVLAASVTVILLALLPGCGKGGHDHADGGHQDGHHHAPPRGGIMIELGEHAYQVEFKIQKELNVFSMWIMDGHADGPVTIPAPQVEMMILGSHDEGGKPAGDITVTLKAAASGITGEKVGDTSQFDAPLADLQGLMKFEARIPSLTIRGREFKDVKLAYDHAKVTQ